MTIKSLLLIISCKGWASLGVFIRYSKALKIRYTLKDRYLVDMHWLLDSGVLRIKLGAE